MEYAQAPKLLAPFMECLAWLGVFFLTIAGCYAILRGKKPQPPNEVIDVNHGSLAKRVDEHIAENKTQHDQLFAKTNAISRSIPTAIEAKVNELRREVLQDVKDLREANADSQLKIHERVNDVVQGVSRLQGQFDQMNK